MWCQAGFDPDRFWRQTPRHFQLVMRGVKKRMRSEADARIRQAHLTATFTAMTQSKGGLKPVDHFLRRAARRRSPADLYAAFRAMKASGMPMRIRKVRKR
jgi:hypothetical protein